MNNLSREQLLINYLLGICTPSEQEDVEQWMEEDEHHVQLLWEISEKLSQDKSIRFPDVEAVRKNLIKRVFPVKETSDSAGGERRKRKGMNRRSYAKAAALCLATLLAGVIGIYIGTAHLHEKQIAEAEGAQPVMLQSRVALGQTANLRFGDGSQIKLNGGSMLWYPETFSDDRREVWLEGEGFFSIIADSSRPFLVHAGQTTTRVLGTSFNIQAYEEAGELRISVVNGKVEVSHQHEVLSDGAGTDIVSLEENQWVSFRRPGDAGPALLERGEGSMKEIIAWKDRVLMFKDRSFAEVVDMLERWYGVTISIEDPSLKGFVLAGEHHDVSLEEVLNSIQFVMDFDYSIKGKEVYIHTTQTKTL